MTSRFRPHVWAREYPWAADALLAIAATVLSVCGHVFSSDSFDYDTRDPAWWTSLLVAASAAPVLYRRARPLAVASTVIAVQLFCESIYVVGSGWIGVIIAVYSVGAYAEGRRRTWFIVIAAVVLGVMLVLGWVEGQIGAVEVLATYSMLAVALIIGDNMRRRRLHMADLAERADRAERERELITRERVGEERALIARELHDIVAHSVSSIVIQATAARRSLTGDPKTSSELLVSIEDTGRQAMQELRRVVGVLRDGDDSDDLSPQPSLTSVDSLVAANSDLPIELTVRGDISGVSSGLGLSAYRILQEAITNVRRHAGTVSRVDVTVANDDHGLAVVVDDDGRGAASAISGDNDPGYGIVGMGERVAASYGHLRVGPKPGGGWRVSARFPIGGT